MHIRELSGKKICILGFGKEGQSVLRALREHAPDCEMTIADRNNDIQTPQDTTVHMQTGESWLRGLDRFDVLIKSPGIPQNQTLATHSAKLTSATQIFLDTIAEDGACVIGVTGSKGKSTTSSLIHEILQAADLDSFLVGNIGNPALDVLEHSSPTTYFVMEMSSYQLQHLTRSPHIAVVTSFFPEHLDYHASSAGESGMSALEAYKDAKKNIARFQTEEDVVIYDGTSEDVKEIAAQSMGKQIPSQPEDAPVTIEETHLLGRHNLSNIALAFHVAQFLDVPQDICMSVFHSFEGLPHRLQSLGIHGGIEWIDDSISTTPESAIAALDALGDRVASMILGRRSSSSLLPHRVTACSRTSRNEECASRKRFAHNLYF
jgi:UDP-N-acetylmuramoylalanine--D-glutamate ligase